LGPRRAEGGGKRRRIAVVSGIAALPDGFSGGAFALVVGATGGVMADLGDGHDVQAGIELLTTRSKLTSPLGMKPLINTDNV
jgi:hypothetical protein